MDDLDIFDFGAAAQGHPFVVAYLVMLWTRFSSVLIDLSTASDVVSQDDASATPPKRPGAIRCHNPSQKIARQSLPQVCIPGPLSLLHLTFDIMSLNMGGPRCTYTGPGTAVLCVY